MEIFEFKGQYFFSVEECIKKTGIKILKKDYPDSLLEILGIKKIFLEGNKLVEIIRNRTIAVIQKRNLFLNQTDKYMLSDYPIGQLDLLNVMSYRQYLRDYTEIKDYWKKYPLSLDEWNSNDNR